jgi:superfamily I DNA/RNA helicase
VCYNITLVNYIKRLLSDKKVPLGENGVEVLHFFELCSKILGQQIAYEKEESDYYDLIVSETLSKIAGSGLKYDAILIDEGQDFSDDMYKVVTSLLNEKTNNLTIALDEGQNIYHRKQTWKDLGIQAKGRLHRISYVYRCTKELLEFSSRLIGTNGGPPASGVAQDYGMFPDLYEYHGPKPQIRQFKNIGEIIEFAADKIKKLLDQGECSCSDIAILYTMKSTQDNPEIHIPHMIGKALQKRGILDNWVSEDYRSKRSYDVTTDTVTISTIQSAKGFDYSRVFLLGLDLFDPAKGSELEVKSLAYVGITRARYELFIPYVCKSDLISKLLVCL